MGNETVIVTLTYYMNCALDNPDITVGATASLAPECPPLLHTYDVFKVMAVNNWGSTWNSSESTPGTQLHFILGASDILLCKSEICDQ